MEEVMIPEFLYKKGDNLVKKGRIKHLSWRHICIINNSTLI